LFDSKNGLVIYAKVEQSERDQHHFLRTNTNRILPIDELTERYHVLNVLENKGQLVEEYKKVEDIVEVTKIDEGKYAVTIEGGESSQRTFFKKSETERFIDKSGIAQSLNTDKFLSQTKHKDVPRLEQLNASHLNARLAKVLKQPNLQAESKHGIAIGWELVKNPQIQSKTGFEKHLNGLNPHLSSTKELKSTFLQLDRGTREKEPERER
ncbi:LtrC-like protein, partial [Listeria monocytogenes]|nr:LtrC-like protein [Listeria monocytogenes]